MNARREVCGIGIWGRSQITYLIKCLIPCTAEAGGSNEYVTGRQCRTVPLASCTLCGRPTTHILMLLRGLEEKAVGQCFAD